MLQNDTNVLVEPGVSLTSLQPRSQALSQRFNALRRPGTNVIYSTFMSLIGYTSIPRNGNHNAYN